jgi:hypothetical protein
MCGVQDKSEYARGQAECPESNRLTERPAMPTGTVGDDAGEPPGVHDADWPKLTRATEDSASA